MILSLKKRQEKYTVGTTVAVLYVCVLYTLYLSTYPHHRRSHIDTESQGNASCITLIPQCSCHQECAALKYASVSPYRL